MRLISRWWRVGRARPLCGWPRTRPPALMETYDWRCRAEKNVIVVTGGRAEVGRNFRGSDSERSERVVFLGG